MCIKIVSKSNDQYKWEQGSDFLVYRILYSTKIAIVTNLDNIWRGLFVERTA